MSNNTAPIGSLMAFGGLKTPLSLQVLADAGWLACDGHSYQSGQGTAYDALFQVIGYAFGGSSGNFNVPDLRGRFMRGLDHGQGRDPDAATRLASAPGGNAGALVGSVQEWATAQPGAPFTSDMNGDHTHQVNHAPIKTGPTVVSGPSGHDIMASNSDQSTSDENGAHSHTLSKGGDLETRPANLNLEWFIKFNNTND